MARNINSKNNQSGVVLITTLVLLIMITLFAVTAIRSSTTELQIAGNAQMRKELAAAAQEGVEMRIDTLNDFNNLINGVPVAAAVYSLQGGRYNVTVSAPACIKSVPEPGTSMVNAGVAASETTHWQLVSNVIDVNTGATMTSQQGVKMRMPIGSCP